MITCDPMYIKSIEDTIPTTQRWIDNQLKVMEKGSCAKLTQHGNLRQMLIDTEVKVLAEASPDKF